MNRSKTIISDIDGTLVKHCGKVKEQCQSELEILPGTIKKLQEWDEKGYRLILLTGRRESLRKTLEEKLFKAGIYYDQLIMGVSNGERILINDMKSDGVTITAKAFSPKRNEGIGDINV